MSKIEYMTEREAIDYNSFANAVNDDIEHIILKGKIAHSAVNYLKIARFADKGGIPIALIAFLAGAFVTGGLGLLIEVPAVAIGTKLFTRKTKRYDYEVIDSSTVEFTMRPDEIEKVRKYYKDHPGKKNTDNNCF
jgi:hypothetical protein